METNTYYLYFLWKKRISTNTKYNCRAKTKAFGWLVQKLASSTVDLLTGITSLSFNFQVRIITNTMREIQENKVMVQMPEYDESSEGATNTALKTSQPLNGNIRMARLGILTLSSGWTCFWPTSPSLCIPSSLYSSWWWSQSQFDCFCLTIVVTSIRWTVWTRRWPRRACTTIRPTLSEEICLRFSTSLDEDANIRMILWTIRTLTNSTVLWIERSN